jgi:uncharacterized protein
MDNPQLAIPWISLALFLVAFLYSSVGHAGASGYIATLTLFGIGDDRIKPIALTLNILVASIGTLQFARAGHFSWPLFWPFAFASVPMAYLGGGWRLPAAYFHPLLGVVLWLSAARLIVNLRDRELVSPPSTPAALLAGGTIGLLAGLTGTGGGIFLTPLMLIAGWAKTRNAAAVSAAFILVNSISGLVGHTRGVQSLPQETWWFAIVAICGGFLGSYLGSWKLPPFAIRLFLAAVLVVAGLTLIVRVSPIWQFPDHDQRNKKNGTSSVLMDRRPNPAKVL